MGSPKRSLSLRPGGEGPLSVRVCPMSPMSPQGSPPVPVVRKGREQFHLSRAITKAVKDKVR